VLSGAPAGRRGGLTRTSKSTRRGVRISSAERFLKRSAISAAYLWCDPGLVGYYKKGAYKVVDVPTGGYKEVLFMGKSL